MKFWNKTALILLRFESAPNNEQKKPQLVVYFSPLFVFRSFSEEETFLEKKSYSLQYHLSIPNFQEQSRE